MTKRKIYLAIQAAVCVALAALLAASAIAVYREGSARRAEHPMESIYTPQIVADRLAPIAPLLIAGAALLAAGLALGVRDARAGKPARDAEISRDLAVGRVARPSDAMRRARAAQRRLSLFGWCAFAACMVPVAVYLTNPAHFPQDDPEGMFLGLIRVLLPWTCLGLSALAAAFSLRERHVLLETEAALDQMKRERAEGASTAPERTTRPGMAGALQAVIIIAAVILIIAGVLNGSARDVLYKAITICTECVGLG